MNIEYECRRCTNRFAEDEADLLERDPRCPVCGSTAVDIVSGCVDALDGLRSGSGGG